MKSYIAHVSSRRLFRALYIESNLARPVIIQIPTQSPGRYAAELPLRRIKLFSFQANSPYVPSTHTLWIFWGLGTKYYFVCTKYYFVRNIISFVRNIISFVRNNISFARNIISFVRNNISFVRNIISFVRNLISFVWNDFVCTK